MKFWKIAAILLLIGILFTSGLGYVFYNTFKHRGHNAISRMTDEDKRWLENVTLISNDMTKDQVYEILGDPSQDIILMAKWRGFGSSPLSELRIYFSDGHPRKVRWMKLGYFMYEKEL
jgi:hypothetical protein